MRRPWKHWELETLKNQYERRSLNELAQMLDRTVSSVAVKANKLGLKKSQNPCKIKWTERQLDNLRRYYPHEFNDVAALMCGVSIRTLIRKARELGLTKDPDFMEVKDLQIRERLSRALRRNPNRGRFKPGEHPCPEHEFKPGHTQSVQVKQKRIASLKATWERKKREARLRRDYGIKI